MKSSNVTASFTGVSIFPPAAGAQILPKAISSAGLKSGWQLWKKKTPVWLPWHSPVSLDHIRWKEGNRQLWHLSLQLMLQSLLGLLDLACGPWTDARLSSPDILGRQGDMNRHHAWHTEERSTNFHFKLGQNNEPCYLSSTHTCKYVTFERGHLQAKHSNLFVTH